MSWQTETYDKWLDLILEDGDDFEAVAKTALQQTCCMLEAALLFPEWAAAFVSAARGGTVLSPRSHEEARLLIQYFPVAMPV